jgi:hypothetical protein
VLRLLPIAALLLAACQPGPNRPRSGEAPKDAVLHDATLSTWRRNAPVVTAKAETVTWYRQDGRFVAEKVDAKLPSRQGSVDLTAPRVDGNVNGEALDASGGVKVKGARGEGMSPTAHCENTPEGTIVSSDAGVQWNAPGQSLTARAFRFDSATQHAQFEGVETQAEAAK